MCYISGKTRIQISRTHIKDGHAWGLSVTQALGRQRPGILRAGWLPKPVTVSELHFSERPCLN